VGASALFVVPVVTGILLVIPGQSTTTLGIEIAVSGPLVGRVLLMLHSAELEDEPRVLVVIDRLSPRWPSLTSAPCSPASSTPGSSFSLQARTRKSDRRQRVLTLA
jgi:hypothetical protein